MALDSAVFGPYGSPAPRPDSELSHQEFLAEIDRMIAGGDDGGSD